MKRVLGLLKRTDGQLIVPIAVGLVVLLSLTMLPQSALHLGYMRQLTQQAADAGALSGIAVYSAGHSQSDANAAAKLTAENYMAAAGAESGKYEFSTSMSISSDNFAKLTVNATTKTKPFLSQLLGQSEVSITTVTASATRSPVNIVLILDRSGSMSSNSAMSNMKVAASRFVGYFQPEIDQMALVSFAWDSKTDVALAPLNYNTVRTAIQNLQPNGGTNTAGAITRAVNELKNCSTKATNIVLLFTDGMPNVAEADFLNNNPTPSNNYAALASNTTSGYYHYLIERNMWVYIDGKGNGPGACSWWPAMPACMGGCDTSNANAYQPTQNPDNCFTNLDWKDSGGNTHSITPGSWADNDDPTVFKKLHYGAPIIEAGLAKANGVIFYAIFLDSGYAVPLSTAPYNKPEEFLKEIANATDKDESNEFDEEPSESGFKHGKYFSTTDPTKLYGLFEEVNGEIQEYLTS